MPLRRRVGVAARLPEDHAILRTRTGILSLDLRVVRGFRVTGFLVSHAEIAARSGGAVHISPPTEACRNDLEAGSESSETGL